MGLFIGASLLTILEILDYLCEVGKNPRHHGEESGHQCLKGWTGYLTPATCPQVFQDRVLGYFWNRRSAQKRSGNTLVTLSLPSPTPNIVGLTPNIWSRSYKCSNLGCSPPDFPSSHSSRKS